MIKSARLIEKPDEELETDEFKESYGTIIEDIDLKGDYFSRYYYPIYLIRRLFYALALVVLADHPMIQLWVFPILFVIPVL